MDVPPQFRANRVLARPATLLGRRGFSLLELLVVLSILVILTAILLPSLSRSRRQGRSTKCSAQLRSVAVAVDIFANEHADRPAPVLWQLESRWDSPRHIGWDIETGWSAGFEGGPNSVWQCPEQRTSYVGNARALGLRWLGDQGEHIDERVRRQQWAYPADLVLCYDLQYNVLDRLYAHARDEMVGDLSDEYYPWPLNEFAIVPFWMPRWGPHNEAYGVLFADSHAEVRTYENRTAALWKGRPWWSRDHQPPEVRTGEVIYPHEFRSALRDGTREETGRG